MRKLLVLQAAALGWEQASKLSGFAFRPLEPVFPAVTCTAQASFRTAAAPAVHGMDANGLFFRDLRKVMFWEQAASLVKGPRFWDDYRANGGRVGMMFWQQSLGEAVDVVLSPAPIHKHSGGMIQDCYSNPRGLYGELCDKVGRRFNLMHYWGPLASRKSSDWILDATLAVMERDDAPGLLLSYLPHLDYDFQRYGPGSRQADRALGVLAGYLERVRENAEKRGYDWVFFGDYAVQPCTKPVVFPNRRLRERGLLNSRVVKGMHYADLFASRAFAVVDHQVAHVYTEPDAVDEAAAALDGLPGVEAVLEGQPRGGDLVLVAEEGTWFAYPWWEEDELAPDYASHVDIHNKPGYDPCELFFGWPPLSVSSDVRRIRGTHGRVGEGSRTAWASSLDLGAPASLLDLARAVQQKLEATP